MSSEIRKIGRRWASFAVVSALCHHFGPAIGPLGDAADGARYADFVDLVTPFAVIGLAAWTLLAVPDVSIRRWWAFGAAAIVYVEGHGQHLAANSINNQGPVADAAVTTHFWDEVFGHLLWYGAFGVLAAIVVTAAAVHSSSLTPGRTVAAAIFGFAAFTTAIEGGMVIVGALTCAAFIAYGFRNRKGIAQDTLLAYGLCAVLLIVWGIWHGGFPQFSELGWI